jgi:apolipoprotein D and lipocalin family protein
MIALDEQNYCYSLVTGISRSYLWVLSRNKTLEETILSDLISIAEQLGFGTKGLIYVEQNMPNN